MAKPIILVTTGRTNLPTRGDDVQMSKVGCDFDYVDVIVAAGGVPLLLPPHADKRAIHTSLDVADALVLTGGGDIHSLCYGLEPHPASRGQDPARDATELLATDYALKKRLPILGICRGAQLLNVAFGGTLIQDIPSQVPGAFKHLSEGLDSLLLHTITLDAGSQFQGIFGETQMAVNSFHHQAVDQLGAGLKVSARARDGIIEAIEAEDGTPVLGVQCHPEECAGVHPHFRLLFDWIVRQAQRVK